MLSSAVPALKVKTAFAPIVLWTIVRSSPAPVPPVIRTLNPARSRTVVVVLVSVVVLPALAVPVGPPGCHVSAEPAPGAIGKAHDVAAI